jgi:NAD(P)-dependent dehydrogenase (short-subunit alcohol dehydrogenase family)
MTRRVALVTGGSRGIGAAAVLRLARTGHDVVVQYRQDSAAAAAVVAAARAHGVSALAVAADLADEAGVLSMFAQVDQAVGVPWLLVNNAGIVDAKARLDEMSAARLQRMFAVNTLAPMLCAREAVRRMSTRHADGPFATRGGGRGGVIVNVSSVAAVLGSPGQYVDYAASKGALDTFTVGLAREVAAEGVRVNAVRPGIIDTDIHASGGQPDRARQLAPTIPMLRPGRADEVAAAICWLASDEAGYATGAILDVSGGR